MLLKELFDNNISTDTPDVLVDDIKFYIEQQDDLHKEYFLPAVDELKRKNLLDDDSCYECFMAMVEQGCKKYQEEYKLPGNVEEIYTKDLKEKVARQFAESHLEEIKDGQYDPKEL
jgi:hypothetical protein